ncbi:helicase associated domain-containing protein [Streptomyces sp. NRRL S-337]|uniref:helicase associated domain-containing protein n=1 Tax=Streptomyces sp. NRRL S-337 TaxID=1463900 RepID=UPI00099D7523|nr:helicase associated domain-containing protein [Streptomyces sp. NRRL S-337]
MPKVVLRAHQREAVDAVRRALEPAAGSRVPARGLRTQVVMATGSGKSLVSVRSAEELRAGRVLVLVPSLDLLAQTEVAWREGGRRGPMIGVSSLRGDEVVFPNTTDVDELVDWVRPFDRVTVFATYASLGLGTLERAHKAGLPGWDLIVVDEAHRTSGRIGKPWAHGDLKVPFTYRVPGGDDQAVEAEGWPASLAGFPLGQWVADARRFYARGDMDEDRVEPLEKLGMVWSHFDVAWEEGLAAARGWAEVNGHLLAPLDATHQGYRVGIWLKNARAAARKAAQIEQRRAEGLPVESSAGALSDERREQLEDIDPSWCPAWPVEWQRAFHLVRLHLKAGRTLPTEPGDVVHQGEDLGRWVRSVRLGWDKLTTAQQWMCEQVLGIEPAAEDEKPKPRRTQADKWAMNYKAAHQFYEREGHLRVPRKHVERIVGEDQEEREHKLGAWIGNQRSRAATLSPERVEQLSAISMRWT